MVVAVLSFCCSFTWATRTGDLLVVFLFCIERGVSSVLCFEVVVIVVVVLLPLGHVEACCRVCIPLGTGDECQRRTYKPFLVAGRGGSNLVHRTSTTSPCPCIIRGPWHLGFQAGKAGTRKRIISPESHGHGTDIRLERRSGT